MPCRLSSLLCLYLKLRINLGGGKKKKRQPFSSSSSYWFPQVLKIFSEDMGQTFISYGPHFSFLFLLHCVLVVITRSKFSA